jgi:hypothetical protein
VAGFALLVGFTSAQAGLGYGFLSLTKGAFVGQVRKWLLFLSLIAEDQCDDIFLLERD